MEMVTSGPIGMPLGRDGSGMRVVIVREDGIEHLAFQTVDELEDHDQLGVLMLDPFTGMLAVQSILAAWISRITETRVLDTYRNEYTDRQTGQVTGGKSDPTPTLMVVGELTIPGLGTRAGIGVTTIEPGAGEDNLKGASTDALKKAATLFGVGLDLYDDTPHEAAGSPQRPARLSQVEPHQRPANNAVQGQQGAQGRAPMQPGTGGPATDGQKRALWAISNASKDQIDQWAAAYGESNATLTKGTASVLIDAHGGNR